MQPVRKGKGSVPTDDQGGFSSERFLLRYFDANNKICAVFFRITSLLLYASFDKTGH